jgi:hypothetical protein
MHTRACVRLAQSLVPSQVLHKDLFLREHHTSSAQKVSQQLGSSALALQRLSIGINQSLETVL